MLDWRAPARVRRPRTPSFVDFDVNHLDGFERAIASVDGDRRTDLHEVRGHKVSSGGYIRRSCVPRLTVATSSCSTVSPDGGSDFTVVTTGAESSITTLSRWREIPPRPFPGASRPRDSRSSAAEPGWTPHHGLPDRPPSTSLPRARRAWPAATGSRRIRARATSSYCGSTARYRPSSTSPGKSARSSWSTEVRGLRRRRRRARYESATFRPERRA